MKPDASYAPLMIGDSPAFVVVDGSDDGPIGWLVGADADGVPFGVGPVPLSEAALRGGAEGVGAELVRLVTPEQRDEANLVPLLAGFGLIPGRPVPKDGALAALVGLEAAQSDPVSAGHMLDAAGFEGVRERIDARALHALRAADRIDVSSYLFFAGDGPKADHRRQAAGTYPLLAGAMSRLPTVKMRIDAGSSLADALEMAMGRREDGRPTLPKAALKRLQGVEWAADTMAPEQLAEALGSISPQNVPRTREDFEAFAAVASTIGRMLPSVGLTFDVLAADSQGKWAEFRKRTAKAAMERRPPEGLDAEGIAEWRRNPPPPDESVEALRAACVDLEEMVDMFARTLVLPAASAASDEMPIVGEIQRRQAREVAAQILIGTKTAPGAFLATRAWHGTAMEMLAVVRGGDPELIERLQTVAEDGWAPIAQAMTAPNGLFILPLTDPRMLADEGRGWGLSGPQSTLNKDGSHGLNHCVATKESYCRQGTMHVLSIRRVNADGTFERLSTPSILGVPQGSTEIRHNEHRSFGNTNPSAEATAAWKWYKDGLSSGAIPINHDMIREVTVRERKRWSDDVARGALYDWRKDELLERAFSAWRPYLPKAMQSMPLADFLARPDIRDLSASLTGRRLVALHAAR
ncbi:hypothetical protein [Methylobacterium sp. 092160098-2]|uniref:hypothetical protein n=1 Tax=Methylobacterium sp. 092160098-2 TaxID=3025129 RepID=UPI0023819A14|nr:hypothetical protein [Methylobacterium sp. 092160098-2]MDE4914922.1 hypothetical protein [Methylobacterium sp. 092160098-2]